MSILWQTGDFPTLEELIEDALPNISIEVPVGPAEHEEYRRIDPTAGKQPTEYGMYDEWAHIVYTLWVSKALLRFFEIWEKGTIDRIVLACSGTPQLKKSIIGKISSNHVKGCITKLENGEWAVLQAGPPIYPHIHRLPPEGRKRARALAFQLKARRLAAKDK